MYAIPFKKHDCFYKVYFGKDKGNIELDRYLADSKVKLEYKRNECGFYEIECKGNKYLVNESNYKKYLVLFNSILNNNPIVESEQFLTPFLKVLTVKNIRDSLDLVNQEDLYVRREQTVKNLVEYYPLRDSFVNRILTFIPVVMQFYGHVYESNLAFVLIYVFDMFSWQIDYVFDKFWGYLCILIQNFINILPVKTRLTMNFVLGCFSKKLISCNFIQNKRSKISIRKLLICDNSLLINSDVSYITQIDFNYDLTSIFPFEFKFDNCNLKIKIISFPDSEICVDNRVEFEVRMVSSSWGFFNKWSKLNFKLEKKRLFELVGLLKIMIEIDYPIPSYFNQRQRSMHCFDYTYIFDYILNVGGNYYLVYLKDPSEVLVADENILLLE